MDFYDNFLANSSNHSRQKRILEENDGIVTGLHATTLEAAELIEKEGFVGTNSIPGGDMFYKPENAVWFQESTEYHNIISTAKTRFPEGFAVITAKLIKPQIDPLWRPFWVVNQYTNPNEDPRIAILEIEYYDENGNLVSSKSFNR